MSVLKWIKNMLKKDAQMAPESVVDTMNKGLILGMRQYMASLPNSYFLQKGPKHTKRIRL